MAGILNAGSLLTLFSQCSEIEYLNYFNVVFHYTTFLCPPARKTLAAVRELGSAATRVLDPPYNSPPYISPPKEPHSMRIWYE